MKYVLILFASLALVAAGDEEEPLFENCPDMMPKMPLSPTINADKLLGLWFHVRSGPVPEHLEEKWKDADCIASVAWKDYDAPKDEYHRLMHVRTKDKVHLAKRSKLNLVPAGEEGFYENNLITTKVLYPDSKDEATYHIQERIVETDEGKSWIIGATCVQKEGGNSTLLWTIKSRHPRMDPKVEQTVVEKVEKYGGVGPSVLRGIGHHHCHE